jgi:hypothetical protein
LQNAIVREVTRKDVVDLIRSQEYLGTLGSGRYYYALYFRHDGKEYLGGACIFGNTAGTGVNMICGPEHAKEVICLIRGCCAGGWPHPHSASYMISRACKLLAKDYGYHIIRAFCDDAAKEEGVIYKSLNFLYLGRGTAPTEYFYDGRWQDSKNLIHCKNRDRSGRPEKRKGATIEDVDKWAEEARQAGLTVKGRGYEQYIQPMTPSEMRKHFADVPKRKGTAKRRFVLFVGGQLYCQGLRKALRYTVLPYETS